MIYLLGMPSSDKPVFLATKAQTFSLNNTTGSYTLWTITGAVYIIMYWGVVTTQISANHTAGGFRLVKNAGVTNVSALAAVLSAANVGAIIGGQADGSSTPTVCTRNAASVPSIAAGLAQAGIMNTITGQTDMAFEYRHTTTDAPESGAMTFYMYWYPLSSGASVT